MVSAPTRCGWGFPAASRKFHYFVDTISLCGKWMYGGSLDNENADSRSRDDCAVCRRKYDKEHPS